jgi:hypothetical protein
MSAKTSVASAISDFTIGLVVMDDCFMALGPQHLYALW